MRSRCMQKKIYCHSVQVHLIENNYEYTHTHTIYIYTHCNTTVYRYISPYFVTDTKTQKCEFEDAAGTYSQKCSTS